jgi:thiosulfate/3-mercaptopyruvate sulfurtransferase
VERATVESVKTAILILATAAAAALAAEMALIQPKELAARLEAKPVVIQMGPNVLYRSHRIPGAIYAGPASKPEGLALLRTAVEKLPHDREIVLYCGCCPWDRCPNVQPSMALLKEMGFSRVKALYLAENFKTNWIDAGYPVE